MTGKEASVTHGQAAGTRTEAEIAAQPACWRLAAGLLPEVAGLLPAPGERVAVAGCGTSWFIAQSYAAAREAAGLGETDAFTASEMPGGRHYDRLLLLSRSGTTTEIIRLAERMRGSTRTVAVTADAGTPVGRVADEVIELAFADEESVVQTRFATTELALLRAHLGDDIEAAAADAEAMLAEPVPAGLLGARQFTFLGTGWSYGLANEAALKLREAAGLWTESYPALEYRHGPVSVTAAGSVVWLLGPASAGLTADITAAGGLAWVDTAESDTAGSDTVGSGRGAGHAVDPMAALVRVHRVALAEARARGLDPDRPRNLTRSVILAPAEPGPRP